MKMICTLLAALLISNMMMATPVIIAKTNNGDWSQASTWNLNRVPADNDSIVIPPLITVKVTKMHTLNNVLVVVSGNFLFDGGKLYLNSISRFILQPGGTISGTSNGDHLKIGTDIKFKGDEPVITGFSYADATTGRSPNGFSVSNMSGSLLPVTFMGFYATRSAQHIQLSWATAQESNNDRFEIERSYDGRQWNKIAIVFGAGNSNVVNKYSYTDKDIKKSLVYYRIRQVDLDGRSQYSAVRIVKDAEMALAEIYVAAPQTVTVQLPRDKKENIVVKVINMNGQVVAQQLYRDAAYQVTVRMNGVTTGVHVVQVSDDNGWREVKKVAL